MDINEYWMNRATVRSYSSRPVDMELINSLIERAAHAPTTGNMQLYSVVVTTGEELRRQLAPAHFNQPQVTGAPLVLTFCADFNRFVKWCQARNAAPGFNNAQSLVAAVIDTVAFAQQFNTLAELAGLGCCWLGTTAYNAPQIAELLGLPSLVVPVITLTVGYPEAPGTEVGRLPLEAIVHRERYTDYTAEDIDRLYAGKEARADSRRFVAENAKQTLAQVFTDVRYPKVNNELFSDVLIEFLRKQGFLQ